MKSIQFWIERNGYNGYPWEQFSRTLDRKFRLTTIIKLFVDHSELSHLPTGWGYRIFLTFQNVIKVKVCIYHGQIFGVISATVVNNNPDTQNVMKYL